MVTTPEAIKRNAWNDNAIVVPAELADWNFPVGSQMSLRAAKLFASLIQSAGVRITDRVEHRVTFASLNQVSRESIKELEEVVDELHATILKIRLTRPDGRPYTKSGPILADAERDDEITHQAELRYRFSDALIQAIGDSERWAVISKQAVYAFTSRYSLRLYTLLSLYVNLRKTSETFLLEDLRHHLGIEDGKYPLFGNLRQRVLIPAIEEINHLAGFQVSLIPQRHGRTIVGVRFAWGKKSDEQLVEAQKELSRTKVGRKARRQGKVEHLVGSPERITRQQIALEISKIEARNTKDIIV